MKLTFLGTRGYIEPTSPRHRRHSALLVSYYDRTIMIDCGGDWRDRVDSLAPEAIFVTHAHPDHAFGLDHGAPCPVYATRESWEARLSKFPIEDKRTITPRKAVTVADIHVEAFEVIHSLRAPAVGYRVSAGRASFFYVPDVVSIPERDEALGGIDIYIGDGARLTQPLVRQKDGKLFGHTTIRAQLGWCEKTGVDHAIFTHCGSEIVAGDERKLGAKLREMATERGVEAEIAHDGMEVVMR